MKQIIEKMMEAARENASDSRGNRQAEWFSSQSDCRWPVIQTRFSEDPSRRNNGGCYDFYTRFRQAGSGIIVEEKSSYEDSDYEEVLFVKSAIDSNGLRRMADLACARVNAEIAPQKIADINVIRRRIEDALRKTATAMDLIAIASLLGVKIE